ncbi:MAG TPA: carbohydrate ABC transporter permease [Aggregatilineaceae bacterium]|nr:carbohydrate ABC transporter permease [Aggregatilineaceae bacterium]
MTPRTLDPVQRRALRRQKMRRASVYALAILIALWILLPIWLIASQAFSNQEDIYGFPKTVVPTPVSTETMDFFLNYQGILQATRNSVVVAVLTLVLSTLLAMPAGYAISRYIFPGRAAFRLSILAVRAFPIVILAVPLAVTFIQWGMFDQVYSVALMHTALTLPTTVLVVSSVFASIPVELEEAARVFGASPFQAFIRVVMPLVLPGVAAAAIFTFVMSWNEVFAATLLTIRNRTLPALILYTLNKSPLEFQYAGGFFMLVPSLVFIFFIRRYLFNMWGQITK